MTAVFSLIIKNDSALAPFDPTLGTACFAIFADLAMTINAWSAKVVDDGSWDGQFQELHVLARGKDEEIPRRR